MSNVPVIESVRAAWEFRRLYWRRVAGALGLLAATGAAMAAAEYARLGVGVRFLFVIAYFASLIVAYGAMLRLAFADERGGGPDSGPGPNGLQWGRPEVRLMQMLLLVFFLLLLAAAMFVFLAVLVFAAAGVGAALSPGMSPDAMMEAIGPGPASAMAALGFAFGVGFLVLYTRLYLAPAATVAEGKVLIFQTWPLTKGQFWRIFAANFLIALPVALAAALLSTIALALVGVPPGAKEAPQLPLAIGFLVSLPAAGLEAFVLAPLTVGLMAYLYRGLRPAAPLTPASS